VAQTASINTGVEDRDNHLRSADFLDVEKWPTMTFQSTAIEQTGNHWKVTGDLTIRDQTHPITLEVEFLGVTGDPWGGTRAGFEATGEIERKIWGLVWNVAVVGGWLVSENVQLEIEAELIAPS
jgi:polyisoprenoid-binding protein YceI